MKKITLLFLTFIGIVSIIQAQVTPNNCNAVYDDFSSSTAWNHPVLSTALCNPGNFNTLNIASGTFNFQQSRDQYLNYFYRTGLTIGNSDFKANIDIQLVANGWGVGHVVLGLTDDTQPFYSSTASTSTSALINSIHNGIAVMFEANAPASPTDFFFQVVINVGGASTIAGLPIHLGPSPVGTTNNYYLELIKMSGTSGLLNVYSDTARTILLGSSGLFTIPSTIVNLNTVQFGTDANQHPDRMYTGKLDNLCIDNTPLITNSSPNVCGLASDDFSNPIIWGHPISTSPLACNTMATMQISSGVFNFFQSRDNNFNFMNRLIPIVSNAAFKADIDFGWISNGIGGGTPTGLGGAGHTVLALNSGFEPFYSTTASVGTPGSACTAIPLVLSTSIQKGIAVIFESDLPEDATDFRFKVFINNGTGLTPTLVSVPISVGLSPAGGVTTMFYLRLERLNPTSGKLSIFNDVLRTSGGLIGSSTFAIPATITNLNVVQMGGNEWQEEPRMLTGFLDNLCVTNTTPLANNNFESTKNTVQIFPNPVTNILNIQSKSTISLIEIIDINGRIIESLTQDKTDTSLNLEKLTSGMYLVKITSADGTNVHKILKQ